MFSFTLKSFLHSLENLCVWLKKRQIEKSHWKISIQLQYFWAFPRSLAFGHKNVVPPWETLRSLTIILLFSDVFSLVTKCLCCPANLWVRSQNFGAWVRNCVFGNKTFAFTWEHFAIPQEMWKFSGIAYDWNQFEQFISVQISLSFYFLGLISHCNRQSLKDTAGQNMP